MIVSDETETKVLIRSKQRTGAIESRQPGPRRRDDDVARRTVRRRRRQGDRVGKRVGLAGVGVAVVRTGVNLIKLSVFVSDAAANYASVCPRQFFSEPVFLVVCDPSMSKL
jgi:hypothetical protein